MLRLRISASLLFALLLQRFSVPVECLGKGKLANDVSLEPTNVVVTFPSEPCGDSALVEWNPPSKGFLVESYRVICEASDLSDRVIEIVDGDTAEVEVGPLQLDSIYSCLVASRSKLGTSQPVASEPFSTKEGCPSPPRNVAVFFSSDPPSCLNNANVSWEPSLTQNIQSYFVQCVSEQDSFNVTVGGNVTSALFGNLSSPMVEYTCSVQAINAEGTSEPAFADPFVTTSCPPIFPTLSFELRLEGFDSPSDFTDADKEQICLNALTLAGLEEDENTRCEVIAVLQGSVIVIIEITTSEPNREQIETFAVALESSSPDVLDQLVQDLSVDNVTVEVLSFEVGESDAEVPDFTVASAVRNVQVESTTTDCETSVTVTWQAPESDGGATISKYVVFCQSETASSPPGAIVGLATRSTSIGPFQPGTFTCTVSAVNAAGANKGTVSEPFEVIACPGSPAITSVSNPIYSGCESPASVEIDFSAASGVVTMYGAVCESINGGTRAFASSQTLSVTVSGLTLGKTYTCRVTAMNQAGSGKASSPSSSIVVVACPGAPGIPTIGELSYTACEEPSSVDVTYSKPQGEISLYNIVCISSDGGQAAKQTSTTLQATVTGLALGKTYTCTVTAQNAAGTGPSSTASAFFKPEFPVKIPAENDGCPEEQYCRSGNGDGCSIDQCNTTDDCGDDLVCDEGLCKQPTLESFLSPIENAPLQRKVFWSAAVPEGYSVKVQCCLPSESEDCTAEIEPTSTDDGPNTFVDIDFTDLINGNKEKIKSYAQNNYECGAKLCKSDICGELILATIKCGYNSGDSFSKTGSITQITGDPLADGFFSIGSSGVEEGVFINPGVFVRDSSGTSIPSIKVFVASFIFDANLLKGSFAECSFVDPLNPKLCSEGTCVFLTEQTLEGFCSDSSLYIPNTDQFPEDGKEVIVIGIDTDSETLTNTVIIKVDPVGSSATHPAVGPATADWGDASFSSQPTVGGSVQLTYQIGGNINRYRYVSADGNAPVENAGFISNVRYITTKIGNTKRQFIVQVDSLLTGGTPFSEPFDNGWKFVVAPATNVAGETNSIAFGLPKVCIPP